MALKITQTTTKVKKNIVYKYKGTVCVPLTLDVALSLDKGDVLKYIGTAPSAHDSVYSLHYRHPFALSQKPSITKNTICLYKGYDYKTKIGNLSLVKRGDIHGILYRKAERYVPRLLKTFKKNLLELVDTGKKRTDKYLDALPLHKKLEFFNKLNPQDKVLYECLYKDIENLIFGEEAPEVECTCGADDMNHIQGCPRWYQR